MREQLLIGGKWIDGSNSDRIDVTNPANGEVITTVANGSPADVTAAVEAAAAAQVEWAKVGPRERAEVLRACWQTLIDHADELAELITLEHGKPLADAKGEVGYAAEFFRWNSEETVRIHGSMSVAPSGNNKIIVRHPPVGVVTMVTPWNFPAAMITRKLAPCLGAGNAAVIKPAGETPLTALRVADLLQGAGVPDGLINIVPTSNSGDWFDAAVDHKATRMVSFTGSTEVGRILLRRCADRVLKVAMELGGNAPLIVFDDADIEKAVEGTMTAKMRHSAETCTAANRIFVEAGIAGDYTAALGEAMAATKTGNGLEDGIECGPMINERAISSISGLVDSAVSEGATVVTGGSTLDGAGHFFEPTVLSGVSPTAAITHEEVFGPVAPVITFTDHDEMIAHANDTEMGLAAYVFTEDLAKGLATAERIEAGMVGVNRGAMSDPAAPFGGMKQSGLGREGASEGIYEFCETQYIAASW